MPSQSWRRLDVWVAALAFVVMALTARTPQPGAQSEATIPNPQFVSLVFRSNLAVASDLYWIRMCGMATSTKTPAQGAQLIGWAEFVTALDPKFYWAYVMGGLLGPITVGEKTYNADRAEALLAKGAQHTRRFEIFIHLAYTQLALRKEPREAAATLKEAATLPGAPSYLGLLATRVLTATGDIDSARTFASAMAQSSNAETREVYQARLQQLDEQEALAAASKAITSLTQSFGHAPTIGQVRSSLLMTTPVKAEYLNKLEYGPDGHVRIHGVEPMRVFGTDFASSFQESPAVQE